MMNRMHLLRLIGFPTEVNPVVTPPPPLTDLCSKGGSLVAWVRLELGSDWINPVTALLKTIKASSTVEK